jgi:hypothetical protein
MSACAVQAKITQTFLLEAGFAAPLHLLDKQISVKFGDFYPGFEISCNYLLMPVIYTEAGPRFSYIRMRSRDSQDNTLNCLGMGVMIRPRIPFDIRHSPAIYAQVSPGLYRTVIGTEGNDFKETFFALETGGGITIGSFDFGALYNMAVDPKYYRGNRWLTIFIALRLSV